MSTPSRRRWFRFSLRTLLVAVAVASIIGAYWARERSIATERRAALDAVLMELRGTNGGVMSTPTELNQSGWIRSRMGDRTYYEIIPHGPLTPATLARLRVAYPEAEVRNEPASP